MGIYIYMKSINSETNQEKIHNFRDDYLIDQELGDHNYIEKIFKFNGYNFQLISLNIPQKNAFRSMTIFNKNQNFLRTKFNLQNDNEVFKETVMKNIVNAIRANLDYIKIKYPDKNQVLQGSGKIPVTNDEIFKKHFKEEFGLYPDTQIFLRVATHGKDKKLYSQLTNEEIEKLKNEDKYNVILFKERFPDDYYLDLVFTEESKIDYQIRFNTIIDKIFELRIPNSYFILCLQEINPVCDVFDCNNPMLNDLQLISVIKSTPHDSFINEPHDPFIEKKIEKGNYEIKINFNTFYGTKKSNSLLFVSNNFVEDEQMSINIINIDESGKNSNDIINLFNKQKSIGQNLCYELNVNGKILYLYNLHSTMIYNKDSLNLFNNEIIPKINDNFIIVGDMNLEADKIQKYRLSKLFRDNFIYSYFLNTPEIAYGLVGYDTDLNTNDVFISRGIELLN